MKIQHSIPVIKVLDEALEAQPGYLYMSGQLFLLKNGLLVMSKPVEHDLHIMHIPVLPDEPCEYVDDDTEIRMRGFEHRTFERHFLGMTQANRANKKVPFWVEQVK